MLRYEPASPVFARRSSRIVQVVRMVRATRIGAARSKALAVPPHVRQHVLAAAQEQHVRESAPAPAENWFAVALRKLVMGRAA